MYKDPFEFMRRMQKEIDESFDNFFGKGYMRALPFKGETEGTLMSVREPLIDLKDEKDHYKAVIEMPGLKREDIDISVTDDYLTVKAEVKKEEEKEEEGYYFKERSYSSFQRSVSLPGEVIPDRTTAEYKNGILEIKLKKKEQAREKQHKVSVQ